MPTLTWRLFITYYLDIMLPEYGKFELKPNGEGWVYGLNQLRAYESNRYLRELLRTFAKSLLADEGLARWRSSSFLIKRSNDQDILTGVHYFNKSVVAETYHSINLGEVGCVVFESLDPAYRDRVFENPDDIKTIYAFCHAYQLDHVERERRGLSICN